MRPWLLALGLAAAAACAPGPEREPREADPAPGSAQDPVLESGADLYARYCASCHGASARGDGPAGASSSPPPSDLTRLATRWGDPLERERLADFLDGRGAPRAHGTSGMPVWGEQLYAGERAESPAREAARRGTMLLIVEYLQTLQKPSEASGGP
ncbi:MAG: cytochrome c [Deltaproteobacteria bacterium]|nr:cytochrome c [Deltaproteobacteria bacterium]